MLEMSAFQITTTIILLFYQLEVDMVHEVNLYEQGRKELTGKRSVSYLK